MNCLRILLSALFVAIVMAGCTEEVTVIQPPADTSPPYINMTQYEFTTEVGTPIDFSNIGGYDDIDGLLPTRLRGYVDYTREGEYYPSIVCTDLSGNESELVITIHVMESSKTAEPTPAEVSEPVSSTCDEGTDPSQPCHVVLPKSIAKYKTIYEGEEGKTQCEQAYGEDACDVIVRNDGSFWGYGAK